MKTELIEKFIEKWNVGYEDFEQKAEFAKEMEVDINNIIQALEKQESEQVSNSWILKNSTQKAFELFPNDKERRVGYIAGFTEAMQTYASKQSDALEFVEWVDNNKYRRNQIMKFWWQDQKPKITYTSEELYNQFLKEKEETK